MQIPILLSASQNEHLHQRLNIISLIPMKMVLMIGKKLMMMMMMMTAIQILNHCIVTMQYMNNSFIIKIGARRVVVHII